MDRQIAARLVEFLPMAYVRIVLGDSGTQFSDFYQRALADGTRRDDSFSSEPIWNAVLAYAQAEVKNGVTRNDLLAIAGRSAEFDAINQLLKRGSKLQNLRLTPAALLWPETGPPSLSASPERRATSSVPAVQPYPYRWGNFQGWMALVQGLVTFAMAYNYPLWRRVAAYLAALLCSVVWWGLRHKRRYGFVLFYVLAAGGMANFLSIGERALATHNMDFFWLIRTPLYLYMAMWSTILYLAPAALYYPKRWNEFS